MVSISDFDYNPLDDLCDILKTPQALQELDDLITKTTQYKQFLLHKEINGKSGSDKDSNEKEHASLSEVYEAMESINKQYNEYLLKLDSTQASIMSLTSNISELDCLKTNLHVSSQFFGNLKSLCDHYTNCTKLLNGSDEDYISMVESYKTMNELASDYFEKEYKSINEINRILIMISSLKETLDSRFRKHFNQLLDHDPASGSAGISQDQLKNGICEIIGVNQRQKSEIIHWIIDNKVLFEFKQVFQIDDETSSLENLSRRFLFFKKVLNNFQSKYAEYFPSNWDMLLEITKKFYQLTRTDLVIILKRDLTQQASGQQQQPSININVFMESLQATLEFEKYIKVKFNNRLSKESDVQNISTCFEPYIYLWIDNQDPILQKKIMQYMSEPKIPSTSEIEDTSNASIIPSSMDLFRTYRQILNQALELVSSSDNESKDKMILQLTKFFNKWLLEYLNKILKNLLLPESPSSGASDASAADGVDKDSIIQYTLLLINTADYCSTTINDLAEKLNEYCPNSATTIDTQLQSCKDQYLLIINSGIAVLLNRIIKPELQFVWKEFNNINWAHVQIEDYSRYMGSLEKILNSGSLPQIMKHFYKELYIWNFWDKIVNYIMETYIASIIKLLNLQQWKIDPNVKPKFSISQVVAIGEQLQLDTELLKKTLYTIQEQEFTAQPSSSSLKRATANIDSSLSLIVEFCKLLTTPIDSNTEPVAVKPKEEIGDVDDDKSEKEESPNDETIIQESQYNQIFKKLTHNCINPAVWAYVLALKGCPWDLTLWSSLWMQGLQDGNLGDWFIFKTPSVKNMFMQFNNFLYNVPNNNQEWYTFVHQDLQIKEFKQTAPIRQAPQKQLPVQQQQQQSNLQQKLESLFNR
ncbi:hypothetical protein ACO0QE_000440 [Hanseniaspora vineae]